MAASRTFRRGQRGIAAAIGLTLALAASSACAENPTPIQLETARAQMENGVSRLARDDREGALESFSAADALVHTPTTGFEVGSVLARLGRLVEARTKLLEVTRLPVTADESPQFAEARRKATRLSDELADRIAAIRIHVRGVAPPGTPDLVVDGSHIPIAALSAPVRVDPGHHQLSMQVGAARVMAQVDIGEREVRDVFFELPAPKAFSPGPMKTEPSAPRHGLSTAVLASIITGAAGLALGTTATAVALSEKGKLQRGCTGTACPSAFGPDVRAANTWADVATASFIVAAVAATIGVVVFVVGSSDGVSSAWLQAGRGQFEF
jgi:hypothetical protein